MTAALREAAPRHVIDLSGRLGPTVEAAGRLQRGGLVTTSPRVLIIVQNLPVPFDRRVWLECRTLRDAGYDVTVVCPRGKDTGAYQVVDGVTIHGYRPYAPGRQRARLRAGVRLLVPGHAAASRCKARRRGRFDVIQACNPPDIFWPLARWFRAAGRVPLRLRPPRPVPGAVRVALPRRLEARPQGAEAAGAGHLPHRRPGHLDQRVLPPHRDAARRQGARRRSPSSAPVPTPRP